MLKLYRTRDRSVKDICSMISNNLQNLVQITGGLEPKTSV